MFKFIVIKVIYINISALTLKLQYRIEEAISCYRRSIEVNESYYPALINLSETYIEL